MAKPEDVEKMANALKELLGTFYIGEYAALVHVLMERLATLSAQVNIFLSNLEPAQLGRHQEALKGHEEACFALLADDMARWVKLRQDKSSGVVWPPWFAATMGFMIGTQMQVIAVTKMFLAETGIHPDDWESRVAEAQAVAQKVWADKLAAVGLHDEAAEWRKQEDIFGDSDLSDFIKAD